MAVASKKGSLVVRKLREKQEKMKQAKELVELKGTRLGELIGDQNQPQEVKKKE